MHYGIKLDDEPEKLFIVASDKMPDFDRLYGRLLLMSEDQGVEDVTRVEHIDMLVHEVFGGWVVPPIIVKIPEGYDEATFIADHSISMIAIRDAKGFHDTMCQYAKFDAGYEGNLAEGEVDKRTIAEKYGLDKHDPREQTAEEKQEALVRRSMYEQAQDKGTIMSENSFMAIPEEILNQIKNSPWSHRIRSITRLADGTLRIILIAPEDVDEDAATMMRNDPNIEVEGHISDPTALHKQAHNVYNAVLLNGISDGTAHMNRWMMDYDDDQVDVSVIRATFQKDEGFYVCFRREDEAETFKAFLEGENYENLTISRMDSNGNLVVETKVVEVEETEARVSWFATKIKGDKEGLLTKFKSKIDASAFDFDLIEATFESKGYTLFGFSRLAMAERMAEVVVRAGVKKAPVVNVNGSGVLLVPEGTELVDEGARADNSKPRPWNGLAGALAEMDEDVLAATKRGVRGNEFLFVLENDLNNRMSNTTIYVTPASPFEASGEPWWNPELDAWLDAKMEARGYAKVATGKYFTKFGWNKVNTNMINDGFVDSLAFNLWLNAN